MLSKIMFFSMFKFYLQVFKVTIHILYFVFFRKKDSKDALQFLEKIKEKTKSSTEANILCSTAMGIIHLVGGDFAKTKVSSLKFL